MLKKETEHTFSYLTAPDVCADSCLRAMTEDSETPSFFFFTAEALLQQKRCTSSAKEVTKSCCFSTNSTSTGMQKGWTGFAQTLS